MRARNGLVLLIFSIAGTAVAYELYKYTNLQKAAAAMKERTILQEKLRIVSPYEEGESWEIPVVIPLSDEQRSYLIEILSAMIRVIGGSSSLESEEERLLGVGQFYWPKNPDEPIKVSKSYFGDNFRMRGIGATLTRKNEGEPWSKADVVIRPRNFPRGVYAMQLPSIFFSEFELQNVKQEERNDERIRNPVVFYYKHKKINNFYLKVEGREDMVNVKDLFPSSFHVIEMLRETK